MTVKLYAVSFRNNNLTAPLRVFKHDAEAPLLVRYAHEMCERGGGGSVRESPERSYMTVVDCEGGRGEGGV